MAINGLNGLTNPLSGLTGGLSASVTPSTGSAGGFGDMVKSLVSQTVNNTQQAEALTTAAATGQDVALSDVIQAVSKAELTLQTLITVRDRAVEAYQQIQQMPI